MPTRQDRGAARVSGIAQATVNLGTQLEFPVFGLAGTISATCRYVGEQAFVFVENRQWDTEGGSVFQSHVDALGTLFEQSTPADSERGIYDLSIETFGAPSDVDGYPQIFILIADLPFEGLIGLFDPNVANHAIPELRRDVIFLDEFAVRRQSYLARGTLAHEFQHLIHWNWDRDEEVWIDEGLSGYAEELAGYPDADPDAVPQFLSNPFTPLTQFPFQAEARYYGSTYLYASFLAEHYGRDLIRELVAQDRNGVFGVDAALEKIESTDSFEDSWATWLLSNATGGQVGDSYSALAGRSVEPNVIESLPVTQAPGFVSEWATQTILFRTPGDVAIDFDGDAAGRYRVWSYAWRAGAGELAELTLDSANQGQSLAAATDSVLLVVGRTSIGGGNFEINARRFVPTAIADAMISPATARLGAGYPNPFNSSVQIPFELSADGEVQFEIFDVLGHVVWRQRSRVLAAGSHQFTWDGRDMRGRSAATGTYRVRLRTSSGELQTPILLLR